MAIVFCFLFERVPFTEERKIVPLPGFYKRYSMRYIMSGFLLLWVLTVTSVATADIRTDTLLAWQEFSYDPYPDAQAGDVNALLLHISEGSGKLRVRTAYQVQLYAMVHFGRTDKDSLRLGVETDMISISGDRHYRDFSLEKLITPDFLSGKLFILTQEGDTVSRVLYEKQDVVSPGSAWPEHVFYFPYDATELRFSLEDISFSYDKALAMRINNWSNALATYYDASVSLETIKSMVSELNPDDPNALLLDEFQLCEAEALAGKILHAPFHAWLNLDAHDPENIIPRFDSKLKQIQGMRDVFNHAIINIDSLYYAAGLKMIPEEGLVAARRAFTSAVNHNPYHIPSHLALSEADLEAGDHVLALKRLASVIADMQPLGNQDEKTKHLADTVLSLFFDASEELIAEDRLTASLDTLAHVRSFCDETGNHFPCPSDLGRLLDVSHRGIYHSFLTVARRAIRNDDVSFAGLYVESALDYQQGHSEHVAHAREAKDMLFRVMTRARVLSDIAMLGGNYDLSTEYRMLASSLAADHPELLDHINNYADIDMLKTGALNYSAAGYIEESMAFLKRLRDKDVEASRLSYHQGVVASNAVIWLKNLDAGADPDRLVSQLTADDPWFQVFRREFHARW